MEQQELTIEDEPDERDLKFLERKVYEFNVKATGFEDDRDLAIFVRDENNEIGAGLSGFSWGGTFYVAYLWVKEEWRSKGYGTRLLDAAETEAVARGCHQVYLNTHSFQAPDFYPKFDYRAVGVLDDYPLGSNLIFFRKRLD